MLPRAVDASRATPHEGRAVEERRFSAA